MIVSNVLTNQFFANFLAALLVAFFANRATHYLGEIGNQCIAGYISLI